MKIFKEEADVISNYPIWVCIDKCWMYTDESLLRLLWIIITEYKHNKHLIG